MENFPILNPSRLRSFPPPSPKPLPVDRLGLGGLIWIVSYMTMALLGGTVSYWYVNPVSPPLNLANQTMTSLPFSPITLTTQEVPALHRGR